MVDGYHILKFIHVYSVIIWLGSAAGFSLMAMRIRAQGTPEEIASLVSRLEWFGKFVYPPLSIVVLVAGIGMAADAWGFTPMWIGIGFLGIISSIAIGVGYLSRKLTKIKILIAAQGPNSREVASNIDQLLMVARIDLLILTLIVLDMVLKPGS